MTIGRAGAVVVAGDRTAMHLQGDLRRTVSTGQGADGTTRSAVLPKKRRSVPERPCVPIAIRSAPIELA